MQIFRNDLGCFRKMLITKFCTLFVFHTFKISFFSSYFLRSSTPQSEWLLCTSWSVGMTSSRYFFFNFCLKKQLLTQMLEFSSKFCAVYHFWSNCIHLFLTFIFKIVYSSRSGYVPIPLSLCWISRLIWWNHSRRKARQKMKGKKKRMIRTTKTRWMRRARPP